MKELVKLVYDNYKKEMFISIVITVILLIWLSLTNIESILVLLIIIMLIVLSISFLLRFFISVLKSLRKDT